MTRNNAWTALHMVLVSPSDVAAERGAAVSIVEEINRDVLHATDVHIEVHRWEEEAYPALHSEGPQTLIEERLAIEDSDLVVAILWSRIGTTTQSGETGTERELRKAWRAWASSGRPQVLLYFCTRISNSSDSAAALQRYKVLKLVEDTERAQTQFIQRYVELDEFKGRLRKDLLAIQSTLTRDPSPQPPSPAPPRHYLDADAGPIDFDPHAVQAFRAMTRGETPPTRDSTLVSHSQFLDSLGVLLPNGRLTRTGALLFLIQPTVVLTTALVQCTHFDGVALTASRRVLEIRGTAIQQITETLDFISTSTTTFESPSGTTGQSEARAPFPMVCLREVIANAIVHRDYEDDTRTVHVRLFADRVEVASPGLPLGRKLETPCPLKDLSSPSVQRNFNLARLLTHVKLIEGAGSGIPTAVDDARRAGVPQPMAKRDAGYTTVTVFRRRDEHVDFADRRVATPLAKQSIDMLVGASRSAPVADPSIERTFSFSTSQPVIFYVPTLQSDPSLAWRRAVTAEDVLATRSVIQALIERWPQVDARTRILEQEADWWGDPANLCAICREERNPVTSALLSGFRQATGTEFGFIPIRTDRSGKATEWGISSPNGDVIESPCYAQERALTVVSEPVDNVIELEDVAMIARFANPWDPEHRSKALIVAGVRAFGTWGAAEYFRTHYDELQASNSDGNFACLLRVRRKYRAGIVEGARVSLYPTDDGSPGVDVLEALSLPDNG